MITILKIRKRSHSRDAVVWFALGLDELRVVALPHRATTEADRPRVSISEFTVFPELEKFTENSPDDPSNILIITTAAVAKVRTTRTNERACV